MKLRSTVISLIFGLIMLGPLVALVVYNRVPPSVKTAPIQVMADDRALAVETPFYLESGRLFLNTAVLDALEIPYTLDTDAGRLYIAVSVGKAGYEDPQLTRQIIGEAGTVNFPLKALNAGWFIEWERLSDWLGIRWSLSPDQNVLLLDTEQDIVLGIVAPGGAPCFTEPGGKGKSLPALEEGQRVRLFSEIGSEYRLRTQEGQVGYSPKKNLTPYGAPGTEQRPFTAVRKSPKPYGPLQITFEYVSRYSANPELTEAAKIQGLDVLCPTWFSLDEAGNVTNDGAIRYTRDAHGLGYRVWGVFRNGFEPDRTHAMLSQEPLRRQAVAAIALYAAFYELDGINIDFENVYKKDSKALSAFLVSLDAALTRQGVVLSVDAAPPWGSDQWSLFLDRRAVAQTADYVILMAYDEHPASSPVSGPVASLGWTEEALVKTLELIPAEKLLLGVPLYTRLWEERPDGAGGISATSRSIAMKDQKALLLGKNPTYVYDEAAGLLLAEYHEDGALKRMWLENEESVKARARLVGIHRLAGLASWRRGFEAEEFWTWVREVMKGK